MTIGSKDFLKVFRLRPPLPKYAVTWDPSVVINQMSCLHPNETLTLEKLSKKLITLIALLTAHRVQTLSKINIKNIETFTTKVTIKIPDFFENNPCGLLAANFSVAIFCRKT